MTEHDTETEIILNFIFKSIQSICYGEILAREFVYGAMFYYVCITAVYFIGFHEMGHPISSALRAFQGGITCKF